MGLKFLPRAGHLVGFAGGRTYGQIARYVGRSFKAAAAPGQAGAFIASAEPVEVPEDSSDAVHLIRQAQKGGLWAADEATAAACGVEFVRLERGADGEWSPAASPARAPKKPEPKAEA